MHESVQHFVERMGVTMQCEGLPRSAGRIFGFLMLSEGPFSLDEIAEKLQVSKASVSTNARLLEQGGFLERSSLPGDRRDYYQMRADAWERMLRVAQRRWEVMSTVITEGMTSLPEGMDAARARLAEAAEFHRLLLEEADVLIEQWQERRGESGGASRLDGEGRERST